MENIIGFSSFDAVRYAEVIHATMLAEDLKTLPAGDSTVIGTKGISLSGGQRQRVSLPLALHHNADILVLDDIFSGLDGSTRNRVCQSVFGPEGLLRRRGSTAITCTHSAHSSRLPIASLHSPRTAQSRSKAVSPRYCRTINALAVSASRLLPLPLPKQT